MGVEYMSIVTHRVAPVSNSRGMFVQRKKTHVGLQILWPIPSQSHDVHNALASSISNDEPGTAERC